MKTFQDLQHAIETNTQDEFIFGAIADYKGSDTYKWAVEGDAYSRQLNTTIMRYQKLLYTMSGKAVPDNFTANHKCASNFFDKFITQETQYLLGNGVIFLEEGTKDKLGTKKKNIDNQLQDLAYNALSMGVSYGFYNLDHVEVFKATEFVPLYDEESGSLMAGIRFWQIASDKPLRATLYELDGYTEYKKTKEHGIEILIEKRPYKQIIKSSVVDGTEIYNGENYPGFPIIPLWGNKKHQSELVGLKQEIDCYDLIKSGFANDLDDASMIYWTLENAGGMDDIDLAKFIEHMKTVKAAVVDSEGAKAEAHTLDIPYQSRETYLTRLENDMYKDAMALDVSILTAGNITATAIRAAYQSLDDKCDGFEYCVNEFLQEILELNGIDDEPTFKRNRVANMTEETTMVLSAAEYLDTETILNHLPFISPDEVDKILEATTKEESGRFEDGEMRDEENLKGDDEENPDGENEEDLESGGDVNG